MANAKEVRTQIKSIQNTRKITKAMEMVAASKMRRAKDRMNAARPYAEKIASVVAHMAQANSEYKHPYLTDREVKRVGYIIVSSDRGLCGGLNINVFRRAIAQMSDWQEKSVEVDVALIGSKALSFFKRFNANIVSEVTQLGDAPQVEEILGAVKVMMDAYLDGKIDRLYIVSNEFVNTMTQSPKAVQLIPVKNIADEERKHHWDYIYEPEAKPVVDVTMNRYIESLVYKAVAENSACEQSARMVAMKAATDNAGNLIGDLELIYNKARQAAITQELSEIVSGAAAV
ncbi:MAG: F-type H+-transporting ATPase subunit gamma [Saprospiraceae bacterium]|jgi:F-type H+-transporting ATPase subunit gamma